MAKKILLILIGVIFALGLCEGGLRLLGIGYPHFYDFDPVLGGRLRPGIKGHWLREGGGYVSINSDGLRDREHAVKKPPNTLRIAVLGDSFAEAFQVNQEEAFWAVMEKQLQKCENLRGRNIEVINFGISGFGTAQELLALRHRVWKYSPDIVLLTFTSGNDVADNSPILNQQQGVPFYVFRDGRLVLDDSRTKRAGEIWSAYENNRNWLGRFYTWRYDTFHILQVLKYSQKIVQDWWSSQNATARPEAVSQGLVGAGMFIEIYREPKDEAWKEAWKVTEALLLRMNEGVIQKGARFYVVVLPNDIQVHPDEAVRNKLAEYPGVTDVFYPGHRVAKLCRSHDIPVLVLAPYFRDYAAQHRVFLHGFKTLFRNTLGSGHWNREGHRLAGQTIARWLCRQLQ